MSYSHYSDFLSDDLFIQWQLTSTQELNEHWAAFLEDHPESRDAFDEAVRLFKGIRINHRELPREQADVLLEKIRHTSRQKVRRQRLVRFTSGVAAVLFMAVASVFIYKYILDTDGESDIIVVQSLPAEDIKLISGEMVTTISSNAKINVGEGMVSITEEGSAGTANIDVATTVMCKVIVPRGKLSSIILPDGSRASMNAGTELEFPSNFDANERRIKIKGEIYIDVVSDARRPFIVNTEVFDVRVHGTSFNVTSYADSGEGSVVLTEGKVEVMCKDVVQAMAPGDLFCVNKEGTTLQSGVDVDEYISWKDGVLNFKEGAAVSKILESVSRYYNVEFRHTNSEIMNRTFSGKFSLSNTIEDVLKIVCAMTDTDYKIVGDVIYINNKKH